MRGVSDSATRGDRAGDGPGGGGRVPTCQWSQVSHFSSCLTVLVLSTPQFALLDVAQGAFSETWWPHEYECITLVHMAAAGEVIAGIDGEGGEGGAAISSGGRWAVGGRRRSTGGGGRAIGQLCGRPRAEGGEGSEGSSEGSSSRDDAGVVGQKVGWELGVVIGAAAGSSCFPCRQWDGCQAGGMGETAGAGGQGGRRATPGEAEADRTRPDQTRRNGTVLKFGRRRQQRSSSAAAVMMAAATATATTVLATEQGQQGSGGADGCAAATEEEGSGGGGSSSNGRDEQSSSNSNSGSSSRYEERVSNVKNSEETGQGRQWGQFRKWGGGA